MSDSSWVRRKGWQMLERRRIGQGYPSAPGYDDLKQMATDLGRPVNTLIALSPNNDPFYASSPARLQAAKWFAKQWRRFRQRLLASSSSVHLRRIHYFFVSQEPALKMWDGRAYENVDLCWWKLINASRDARYLRLVPPSAFVDHMTEEPLVAIVEDDSDASIFVDDSEELTTALPDTLPLLPLLQVLRPLVRQRYLVEIWVEKSTLSDILLPLHRTYGVNVVTGVGEMSDIRCQQLVDRVLQDGRRVRILYISDFDPGGQSMPVAVARKIEHRLRIDKLKVDIEVRPILLTHEQCVHYQLPRMPIKDTETRAGRFEERFGEGATELDALEALHPGEIRRILVQEIERYYDPNLQRNISRVASRVERDLARINSNVLAGFARQRQQLEAAYAALVERYERDLQRLSERHETLRQAVTESLEQAAPDSDGYGWPEPRPGNEDPDPMFKSTRGYVEQIDRYKRHQGKPITRRRSGCDHD
jgi:hypothetical protein